MDKQGQGNKDWIARQEGRIPSKGAQAAERASAGLGATDHDAELMQEVFATRAPLKPAPNTSRAPKE